MSSLRDWKIYSEALVKRGLILLDLDFVADWSRELKAMNESKEGGRYRYPESFVKLLAVVHAYVLPYRQPEGFMRALSQRVDGLKAPDYTTIRSGFHRHQSVHQTRVDPQKWKVKRGFIKIYIAVDTKTKQILAIEVTKEDVGDGRMLKRLVDGSSSKAGLKGVVADGAYDSKSNFRMLADRGIDPLIRVRKNSSLKGGGFMPRKFAVVEQLGNADWRSERGYGYRWMVESAFSSIKRVFGEYICAVKWPNIVKELLLKASIYNLFMKMNLN
jgi:transposase